MNIPQSIYRFYRPFALFAAAFCAVLSAMGQVEDAVPSVFENNFPKHEERAVWMATIGGIDWPRTKAVDAASTERQKAELCSILDKLQRANINVVILQTRIRGSVIYPSDIEPWDNAITGRANRAPSYDPLAFAIEECHRRGMELHAWLVSIPLGTVSRQNSYGQKSIMKHHKSLCKTVGGEVFMIPGNPATADYIAELAKEIVERYDVDGISLDYIRYPEAQYRFSDDNLYSASSGLSKAEWRRENITRIVRRVHDVVKAIKPWVKLSSSPIGKYSDLSRYRSGGWDCFNAVYQDPQAWLRDNIQDMLFPMMYFLGNHYYPFVFNWRENNYGHPVAAGLGIYFLDPKEGKWQLSDVRPEMHVARKSGMGGIAFYRSDYLTRNIKGLYDATCDEFFPYPALTTPMAWMNTPAPIAPRDLVYSNGQISWAFDAETTRDKWPFIHFNIYGSNNWPVDVTKPENLLATRQTGTHFSTTGRAATKSFYAVTAVDRFGNESAAAQEPKPAYDHPSREEIYAAIRRHFATESTTAEDVKPQKLTKPQKQSKSQKTAKAAKPAKPAKASRSTKPSTAPATIDFSKYLN